MNYLEHYIEEIHEVFEIIRRDSKGVEKFMYLEVDLSYTCYSDEVKRDNKKYFSSYEEFEEAKQKGYYMA